MLRYRLTGACALAALVLPSHGAAQGWTCPSSIWEAKRDQDFDIVGRCEISGTDIDGNVTLYAGGSLVARDVRIRGNLEASRADFVDIEGSRIDGNVELEGLVGDRVTFERNDIRGNVLLAGNRSRIEILNNDIRGDLQAFGNTGGLEISGNSLDDGLECAGNAPAPVGVGNRVDDDAEGQCANLRPASSEPTPASPPPTATPSPPATTTPPATPSTPAPPSSGAETPPAATVVDEGGIGSMGWPAALLLPLLWWRRRATRSARAPLRSAARDARQRLRALGAL